MPEDSQANSAFSFSMPFTGPGNLTHSGGVWTYDRAWKIRMITTGLIHLTFQGKNSFVIANKQSEEVKYLNSTAVPSMRTRRQTPPFLFQCPLRDPVIWPIQGAFEPMIEHQKLYAGCLCEVSRAVAAKLQKSDKRDINCMPCLLTK